MRDFSYRKKLVDSLNRLENASNLFREKIKSSMLEDAWFKKVNSDEYERLTSSIKIWINILEKADKRNRKQLE